MDPNLSSFYVGVFAAVGITVAINGIFGGLVATVFSVLATMALFYFFILKNFK